MNEWQRQHFAAIFIGFLSNLKEMIFSIIAVLILGQSSQANGTLFYTIVLGIIIVFSLATGVVRWVTFRYQLYEDELRVKQGIFLKKNRFIRKERIQSIDINAKPLQRLFHLVELRIETAGGGAEPEFKIIALKSEDAELIKERLLVKEKPTIQEEISHDVSISENNQYLIMAITSFKWQLTNKRLVIAAITSSGIGIATTIVAAIISQFQQFIPDSIYQQFVGWVLHSSILFIGFWVVVVLLIGWIITIINTMLKYGEFKVEKNKDELHISRGVLEKRQLTLSEKRITSVRVVQNIIRQPFGYVAIYVESAGGGRKEEDLATILIPLCKRSEVKQILKDLLPEFAISPNYESLPLNSGRRYMIKLIIPALFAAVGVAYYFPYGWVALVLPVLAGGYGYWQFVTAGIGITGADDMLLLRYRTISRSEVWLPKKRIQSLVFTQTIFQRLNNLYTIHASILSSMTGKTFSLKHIGDDQRERVVNWYSYEPKEKVSGD